MYKFCRALWSLLFINRRREVIDINKLAGYYGGIETFSRGSMLLPWTFLFVVYCGKDAYGTELTQRLLFLLGMGFGLTFWGDLL